MELVFLGVPLEVAAELVAVVGEAAEDAGVGAVGDVGHGAFTASDTVDPVSAMAAADVWQAPVFAAEGGIHRALGIGGDAAAIDVQRAFVAVEDHVVEGVLGAFVNDL